MLYIVMLRLFIQLFYPVKMYFGGDDEFDSDLKVNSNSVTLRWREGQHINDMRAVPYIGYNILIRRESTSFISVMNVTFQVTPDQWQEVTVTGLEPDTQYWFDIVVYRNYSDGRIFKDDDYTAENQFGPITTTTLQSNII